MQAYLAKNSEEDQEKSGQEAILFEITVSQKGDSALLNP